MYTYYYNSNIKEGGTSDSLHCTHMLMVCVQAVEGMGYSYGARSLNYMPSLTFKFCY